MESKRFVKKRVLSQEDQEGATSRLTINTIKVTKQAFETLQERFVEANCDL